MILIMFNVLTFSKLVGENGCVVALDALEKWIQHINSFKIENIKTICSAVQNANFKKMSLMQYFVDTDFGYLRMSSQF